MERLPLRDLRGWDLMLQNAIHASSSRPRRVEAHIPWLPCAPPPIRQPHDRQIHLAAPAERLQDISDINGLYTTPGLSFGIRSTVNFLAVGEVFYIVAV